MAQRGWPQGKPSSWFLYEDQARRILDRHHSKRILVLGGPGMGKTALLQLLADGLKGSVVIHGHAMLQAAAEIQKHANDVSKGKIVDLFIDDIDFLTNEKRWDKERQKFDRLHQDLDALISGMGYQQNCLLVASSSTLPSRLQHGRMLTVWSRLFQEFLPEDLNPWAAWDKWISAWEEGSRGGSDQATPFPQPASLWVEALRELAGGHPALVGAAFSAISHVADQLIDPADKRQVRQYLEDCLVRDGLPSIEKSLSRLRDSSYPEDQEAFAYLSRLARKGSHAAAPENPTVRRPLTLSGLAYRVPQSDSFQIPGSLIQDLILHKTQAEAEAVTLRLEEASGDPFHGTVLIEGLGQTQQISLSHGPWQLAKAFYKAKGKVISLEHLKKELDLPSKKAFYSVLQRFDQKTRNAGMGRLVENVRKHGYRLKIKTAE